MAFFSLLKQFNKLSLCSKIDTNILLGGIRGTKVLQGRRKKRFTMPPYWLPKQTRVLYPENLTKSNIEYIKEVSDKEKESLLNLDLYERPTYKRGSLRCGVIATNLGSHKMWLKDGKIQTVSLLHVSENQVVKSIDAQKTNKNFKIRGIFKKRRKGLVTLIVGSDYIEPQLTTSGYYKFFENTGVPPKKRLTKFIITPDSVLPPGTPLFAAHFNVNDRIDMMATSIDRGYQGGMKRWKFHGMPAAHGNTKSHRRIGSVGTSYTKIRPGKKMPGHMGRNKVIHRGIEIVRINTKYNVIYVRGHVPGPVGSYCVLVDSLIFPYRRNPNTNPPPYYPTYMPEYGDKQLPENLYSEKVYSFDQPSIEYEIKQEKGRKKK